MAGTSNKMISNFTGKPQTSSYFDAIDGFVTGFPSVKKEARSQVSYAVNRKFLWLWAYEKTPDGTLYLNVTLDHAAENTNIHSVTQTSANRWNHHVEVKSAETAGSPWLQSLIREGVEFASR